MIRSLLFGLWLLSVAASATVLDGGSMTSAPTGVVVNQFLNLFWFDESEPIQVNRAIVAPVSAVAYKGRNYLRSSTLTVSDFRWNYEVELGRPAPETITRSSSSNGSLTPSDVDQALWTYVGNGTVSMTLSCPSRSVTRTVTASSSTQVSSDLTGYVTGSALEHCVAAIDSRIAGKTKATNGNLYTTQNHADGVYTRNTNFWAADLVSKLTCISPWNSIGTNTRAGTLVSPRHILFSTHYQIPVGAVIRFVTADNVVVTRTVTGVVADTLTDIAVGRLDSDVPGTISFCKVVAAADSAKLQIPTSAQESLNYEYRVPALVLDQEEKGLAADMSYWGSYTISMDTPVDATRLLFYEPLIGGDSGNPAFLIINGELAIQVLWKFGGAGAGPYITGNIALINAAMTSLGGGYQLTTVDLSGFTTY